MNRTGTFATDDQVARLKQLAGAPYMVFGGKEPVDPLKEAHRYALEQGLPEIQGYYGCDLSTGEFISA